MKQLFERNEIAILIQSEFTVKCGVRDFHVYNGGWFSCVQWWMVFMCTMVDGKQRLGIC